MSRSGPLAARPLFGLLALVLLATGQALAGSLPQPESSFELPNGAKVHLVPATGPSTLTASLPIGWAHDPPGQEGIAELLARSLTGGSGGHRTEGELMQAFAEVVDNAFTTVGPERTHVVLTGVRDLRRASALLAEMLADPIFDYSFVMPAARALSLELAREARGRAFARERALESLWGAPRRRATATSVLDLQAHELAERHLAAYSSSGLILVLSGESLPGVDEVQGALAWSLGRWRHAIPAPEAAPAPAPAARPRSISIRGGDETRCTAAVPAASVGGVPSALALQIALDRLNWSGWGLAKPGLSGPSLLSTAPGAPLLVEGPSQAPQRAVRRLRKELRRISRGGPEADELRAAEDRLSSTETPADEVGIALIEAMGTETASADAVAAAAGSLASGPIGEARTWAEGSRTRASALVLGGPPSFEEGQNEAKARDWARRALEAHGGHAVLEAAATTQLCEQLTDPPGGEIPMRAYRADASFAGGSWREEIRSLFRDDVPPSLRIADGENNWFLGPHGVSSGDSIVTMRYQYLLSLAPIRLLQRASDPALELRWLGPSEVGGRQVIVIALTEPGFGLAKLHLDPSNAELIGAEAELSFGGPYAAVPVEWSWSGFTNVEGVRLPSAEQVDVVGFPPRLPGIKVVRTGCAWTLRDEAWDPVRLRTSEDDLTVTLEEEPTHE